MYVIALNQAMNVSKHHFGEKSWSFGSYNTSLNRKLNTIRNAAAHATTKSAPLSKYTKPIAKNSVNVTNRAVTLKCGGLDRPKPAKPTNPPTTAPKKSIMPAYANLSKSEVLFFTPLHSHAFQSASRQLPPYLPVHPIQRD